MSWYGRGDFLDLESYAREHLGKGEREALGKLTGSAAGARLAARVNGGALEEAARKGDMSTLSSILRDILSTPEGQSFAAEVRKAVKRDEQ